jgi:hypothetical protein
MYDGLVLNIDLTDIQSIFPNQHDLWDRVIAHKMAVLNKHWMNIDKVLLQEVVARSGLDNLTPQRDTPSSTPVIIKTRNNYGGEPEQRFLECRQYSDPPKAMGASVTNSNSYIVTTWGQARSSNIDRNQLCIELYIENPEDVFFRVYISGLAVLAVRAHCAGDIKKVSNDPRDTNCFSDRESLDLLAKNDKFGRGLAHTIEKFLAFQDVDFCSLDIVTNGTDHYIVDINTTPWCGTGILPTEVKSFLQAGLLHPDHTFQNL